MTMASLPDDGYQVPGESQPQGQEQHGAWTLRWSGWKMRPCTANGGSYEFSYIAFWWAWRPGDREAVVVSANGPVQYVPKGGAIQPGDGLSATVSDSAFAIMADAAKAEARSRLLAALEGLEARTA